MALAAARREDPKAPPQGPGPDRFGAFVERRTIPGSASGGPLAGLGYAAKDLVDLTGRAPTCGLPRPLGKAPAGDAAVIRHLRDAGARLVGLTEMTALAYEPSGANPGRARPRNPWNPDYICGGSSSGSAVAVAAGEVPVALGSDTAGSLRIPAHCCGLFAWKPTPDLVPTEGTMPLAPSLDVLGFLAWRGSDLRRVGETFTGPAADGPITRIAVARDLLAACDPAIADAVGRIEGALRDLGLRVTTTDLAPLLGACDAAVLDVLQGEAARVHSVPLASGALDPTLARRLARGLLIPEDQIAAARATLLEHASGMLEDTLHGSQAVVLPVMRIATPPVGACDPDDPSFSARTLYELSALTRWVNGLGLPAVAVPAGHDRNGLPIAIQIVARANRDRALLALAEALAPHAAPDERPRPTLPACDAPGDAR